MDWRYWLLTIVTSIVASSVFQLVNNYFRRRNEYRSFLKDMKVLRVEIEGNLKGRGDERYPFQIARLEKILDSKILKEKYPDLHELATKCYEISGRKLGRVPGEGQAAMKALLEKINEINFIP